MCSASQLLTFKTEQSAWPSTYINGLEATEETVKKSIFKVLFKINMTDLYKLSSAVKESSDKYHDICSIIPQEVKSPQISEYGSIAKKYIWQ